VRGASVVRTEDEVAGTTEDATERRSAAVLPSSATMDAAVRCLYERFGSVLEAEYVPGKTELRDTLSVGLGISQLAAEELCDELERAGRIGFLRTDESFGWHIHTESDLPGAPM
jgi:hypothetical protein